MQHRNPKDFIDLPYEDVYDWIQEFWIADEDEVDEIVAVKGATVDTLNSIIYDKTGYEDLESYVKWENPY